MDENIISLIAKELNIAISQVKNTLELLEEGATVPFIARYRKERTKGLDEEQIRVIQENYAYQVNLAKRKEEVLARIETLGKLDDEIIKTITSRRYLSSLQTKEKDACKCCDCQWSTAISRYFYVFSSLF